MIVSTLVEVAVAGEAYADDFNRSHRRRACNPVSRSRTSFDLRLRLHWRDLWRLRRIRCSAEPTAWHAGCGVHDDPSFYGHISVVGIIWGVVKASHVVLLWT